MGKIYTANFRGLNVELSCSLASKRNLNFYYISDNRLLHLEKYVVMLNALSTQFTSMY